MAVQQYTIKLGKLKPQQKYEAMKFNIPLQHEFIPNLPGKILRNHELESNSKIKNNIADDEEPKFGAGSSYSQFIKGEKQAKDYKKKMDDKTWNMNIGSGKSLRSYKGLKEGLISENASYYVLMQSSDGSCFEAFPISNWYSFKSIPKYKTLDYDEAEMEFERRDKIQNYFSVMVQKRLNVNDENPEDKAQENGQTASSFTLRNIDERSDGEDDDMFENENGDNNRQHKINAARKKALQNKKESSNPKKKKENLNDSEPGEESDDGDVEGQELDYMSTTSEDETVDINPSNDNRKNAEEDQQKQSNLRNNNNNAETATNMPDLSELLDEEQEPLGVADEPGLRELHYLDDEDENDDFDQNNEEIIPKDSIEDANSNTNSNSMDGLNENTPKSSTALPERDDGDGGHEESKKKSKKRKKENKKRGRRKKPKSKNENENSNQGDIMTSSGESLDADEKSGHSSSPADSESSSTSSTSGATSDESDLELDDNIKSSIFLQKRQGDAPHESTKRKGLETSLQRKENANKRLMVAKVLGDIKDTINPINKTVDVVDNKIENLSMENTTIDLNEENVKKYLQRRPMTAKELLHKFKSGAESKEQLAERMTAILKNLNPQKKMVKGKLFLSLM